jgi:hypothetical protein
MKPARVVHNSMKVWHAVSAGVVVILASAGLARVISESAPPPPESATSTHADKANSSTTPLSIWDRNYPTNQPFPGPPKNLSAEQAQAVTPWSHSPSLELRQRWSPLSA